MYIHTPKTVAALETLDISSSRTPILLEALLTIVRTSKALCELRAWEGVVRGEEAPGDGAADAHSDQDDDTGDAGREIDIAKERRRLAASKSGPLGQDEYTDTVMRAAVGTSLVVLDGTPIDPGALASAADAAPPAPDAEDVDPGLAEEMRAFRELHGISQSVTVGVTTTAADTAALEAKAIAEFKGKSRAATGGGGGGGHVDDDDQGEGGGEDDAQLPGYQDRALTALTAAPTLPSLPSLLSDMTALDEEARGNGEVFAGNLYRLLRSAEDKMASKIGTVWLRVFFFFFF
jgi:hypothetical protein